MADYGGGEGAVARKPPFGCQKIIRKKEKITQLLNLSLNLEKRTQVRGLTIFLCFDSSQYAALPISFSYLKWPGPPHPHSPPTLINAIIRPVGLISYSQESIQSSSYVQSDVLTIRRHFRLFAFIGIQSEEDTRKWRWRHTHQGWYSEFNCVQVTYHVTGKWQLWLTVLSNTNLYANQ